MWCPVCKNEYREGFTHCPDCDVDLVESLDELPVPVIFGEEDELKEMAAFLQLNGMADVSVSFDEKDKVHELMIRPADKEAVKEMLQAYLQNKAMEQEAAEDEEDSDGQENLSLAADPEEAGGIKDVSYVSMRQKAEEFKSSSLALILVGAVGLVFLVALYLDVLPIRLAGSARLLICGVMGVLFIAFIAMGISSGKSYKRSLALALEEEKLIEAAQEYLRASLTKEKVEEGAAMRIPSEMELGGMSRDEAYFPRLEVIRSALKERFPEMEEPLREKLADDRYTELYEEA